MSIIEEAARRLQQLRQAKGFFQAAESPDPATAAASLPPARARRNDEAGAAGAGVGGLPKSGKRNELSRRVEVDLVQLAAKGIITPDAPRSHVADEYRVLKRPLLGNAQGKGQAPVDRGNLIMVTSSVPGEGKTFTAINLAISIAMELDNTVLLVDADVSRPSVLNVLGLPAAKGLMDLLLDDELHLGDVMLKTNIEKLTLVPVGSAAKRATELLASEAMTRLLDEMATRYSDRIIIFDSPPLLVTTEAPVLASHVGQVLLVVEAEQTPQSVVKQALATIQSCPVVLTMLNKASSVGSGTYYDYYGYYGGGYGAFGDGAS